MPPELPRAAAHGGTREVDTVGLQALRHFRRDGLAVPFGEFRLGVKGVHMAHAAVHKQMDHGLGVCRPWRFFRGQRIDPRSQRRVAFDQRCQRHRAETLPRFLQQLTSGIRLHNI